MSKTSGVGMPASLLLERFGDLLAGAFGENVYQVGSSLCHAGNTSWRDVDVRVLMDDDEYEAQGYGDPERPHSNARWVAMTLAFSALGKQMTGLPIDFQIQQRSYANEKHDQPRSALGIHSWIMRQPAEDAR